MIADMCFQLRKNESASVFSEKFFERLYTVEERAYLKYAKRGARAARAAFDKEAASREFAENYKENLAFVKANLPEDILADVKDIRVLALGTATNDMAMRITRFCGKKNRLCEATERSYNNASEEADEKIGGAVASCLISLTGARIAALDKDGDNATLIFHPAQSAQTKRLTLKDAALTDAAEGSLADAAVIKYELLIADEGGFDFSVLALSKDEELLTTSYRISGIEI